METNINSPLESSPNDRQTRVASLIKEVMATFIQHEANSDPMITVTRVDLSPNYRRATVYITTLPEGKEHDALIFLKRFASEMRQALKKKTNLKIIPHLEFDLDVGERHRQYTDKIFNQIAEESNKKSD